MLSDEEKELYSRQIMMIGEEGQNRLKSSKAVIAGCGGLGSPIVTYLAVAGVGNIRVIDMDSVEISNLNRQILHWHTDIEKDKVRSAGEKLEKINPYITVETIATKITEDNAEELLSDADIIIDALDNYEARFLLNRVAVRNKIALIHGAVHGFHGQMTTIVPGKTPCLECLFKRKPPKELFPIIGASAGVVGTMQANEAIKYLLGEDNLYTGRLVVWDGKNGTTEELKVCRNPSCEICGSCDEK
ncbi:adenylyltransferase/sulfurtransferase [Methanohalophilus levihalophilus]|uniref:HesA/MoeB/ThiF family protein n=1 Tax=Methanohalophilus levihalophilus TaxID=1431282 RepID=UPI001AE6ED34|nr:HesA/MoeB/ThiF family protein [Methanohalophilus levihalophilus]MBP2030260.1 adenylyltransferase/sulfurtransferase [Methanohalophilus levihalophilus]